MKDEIEAVRSIIKATDSRLAERIKYKASSYYFKEDLVTFHLWAKHHINLIFHYVGIVQIMSSLLLG